MICRTSTRCFVLLSILSVLELALIASWLMLNSDRLQQESFLLSATDIGSLVVIIALMVGTVWVALTLNQLNKPLFNTEEAGAWPAGVVATTFSLTRLQHDFSSAVPRQSPLLQRLLLDALLPPQQRWLMAALAGVTLLMSGMAIVLLVQLQSEVNSLSSSEVAPSVAVPPPPLEIPQMMALLGGVTLLMLAMVVVLFFWKQRQARRLAAYGQLMEGQLLSVRRGGKGAIWAKVAYRFRGESYQAPLLLPMHTGLYPPLLARQQRQQSVWIVAAPEQLNSVYLIDPHIELLDKSTRG